jgi:hypothetical protein
MMTAFESFEVDQVAREVEADIVAMVKESA